jgi:hypothetical protein
MSHTELNTFTPVPRSELDALRAALQAAYVEMETTQRERDALRSELDKARDVASYVWADTMAQMDVVKRERDALLDVLFDMVLQHCTMPDGTLDSCAYSVNASAMRTLAELGRL